MESSVVSDSNVLYTIKEGISCVAFNDNHSNKIPQGTKELSPGTSWKSIRLNGFKTTQALDESKQANQRIPLPPNPQEPQFYE